MLDDTKNHFTICECKSPEHVLHWSYDPGFKDWPDEIYLSVFLNDYPSFWTRVKYAVMYIFGHKSNYGHFDVTCVGRPEAQKLVDFLQNTYLKQPSPKD